jgi:opacity protein-like surface antigen
MKKLVLLTALLSTFGVASALDLGLNAGRDYAKPHSNDYGLTLGKQIGDFSVTAGFDDVKHTAFKENRYSVVAGYDLYNFKGNKLTAKVGGAYINETGVAKGFAGTVGAGLTIPVAKNVALTADYHYQQAQKHVDFATGNNITAGIKISF